MKNKKFRIIAAILIVVLLLGIFILIDGINIGLTGVISFSTKYYDTPKEAFEHSGTQLPKIIRSIDFVRIDDQNGMFIGTTDEYEEENYIFISMQTQNDKYYCSGLYAITEDTPASGEITYKGDRAFLYGDWGRCQGQYEFTICAENDLQQLDEDFTVQHITAVPDSGFYFAYRIV